MSILNPCCCITLRAGAKAVATIDIVVTLTLLIIFLTDLVWTISNEGKPVPKELSTDTTTSDYTCDDEETDPSVAGVTGSYVTGGVWTILTVFFATNVGISALLYTGATNYSIRRCKWWFYIQTVIAAITLLVLILIVCFAISFTLLILDLIHLIYRLYTLWVVYLFIGELTYLDTLYSLNSSKKGTPGSTLMYSGPQTFHQGAPPMYTSTSSLSYHNNMYPYAPTPPQAPQYHTGDTGISSQESPFPTHPHPHYSDDGLPSAGRGGGIDNPTYLP